MTNGIARDFAVSFAVGLFVGLVYASIKVRSPAPPLIALVGLLGMVIGEQLPQLVRSLLSK